MVNTGTKAGYFLGVGGIGGKIFWGGVPLDSHDTSFGFNMVPHSGHVGGVFSISSMLLGPYGRHQWKLPLYCKDPLKEYLRMRRDSATFSTHYHRLII